MFFFFRTVFCDAFHKALYGEKIQWLIVGMYEVRTYSQKFIQAPPIKHRQSWHRPRLLFLIFSSLGILGVT